MRFYKHYSFDLWLTLIKSNPQFKIERTRFFYEHYNSTNKSLEEVGFIFRQVDLMVNSINEKTGKNIDAEEMYLMVISIINDYSTDFDAVDVNKLYDQMEELLFNYLPQVYCDNTVNVLEQLKSREDVTLSLLSNTGFIKGKTLRKILNELTIGCYLDFQLYSDELRLSKPNKEFYKVMLAEVAALRGGSIDFNHIIHIGDNKNADIIGASNVGINSLQINSTTISILNLLN